ATNSTRAMCASLSKTRLAGSDPPGSQNYRNITVRRFRTQIPYSGGMDFDSLRCFEAAANTLRFRAAAARVHLSPAAFSDRIRRLEESLGVSVLRRTTKEVALTETGHRILPLAREALAQIDRLRAAASAGARPLPYEVVVGTRYELGLSWLCPALEPLERKRPERTIHLYNGDTPDLLRRLERGDLDAVVASMRLTSPRLAYAALHP